MAWSGRSYEKDDRGVSLRQQGGAIDYPTQWMRIETLGAPVEFEIASQNSRESEYRVGAAVRYSRILVASRDFVASFGWLLDGGRIDANS